MADTWLPGSVITLYRVPWDAQYTNVVDFADIHYSTSGWDNTRDQYFASLESIAIQFDESTYMPVNQPIVIDLPYEDAYMYNYCVVTNPRFPTWATGTEQNTRYYFITDVRYNNPHACTLTVQLDVWQTFFELCTIGTVYLEQGHLIFGNAYANGYKTKDDGEIITAEEIKDVYGPFEGNAGVPWNHRLYSWPEALRNYWNIAPGLDVGDEMTTFSTDVFSLDHDVESSGDNLVFITSTADLKADAGTIDDPNLDTANGGIADGIFSGCSVYAILSTEFANFMEFISSYSWVAQCIISIVSIPKYMLGDLWTYIQRNEWEPNVVCGKTTAGINLYRVIGTGKASIDDIDNVLNLDTIRRSGWSERTQDYSDIPLLWSYPYSVIEMTNFSGTSIFLKPQLLGYDTVGISAMAEVIPPFTRLGVYPAMYGASGDMQADYPDTIDGDTVETSYSYRNADGRSYQTIKPGDYVDTALWFTDFPQWSIVNNNYITYMASTANTRAYNYSSAEWSYTSSTATQANTYANSTASLATDQANYEANREAQISTNKIDNANNLINMGSNIAGDALSLNIGGLVSDAVSGLVNYGTTLEKQNISLSLAAEQQANNQTLGYYQLNNNNELANYINAGNYTNAVNAIDAGIADAALTTPSQVGSMGGNGFRYANGLQNIIAVRYKRVNDDAIVRTGDYIRRYGMLIHRYITMPNPSYMQFNKYWSYYKCPEMAITSESYMDETTRDAIRGIFAKGVTIWGDPNEIGKHVPKENTPALLESQIAVYY